MHLGDYVFDMHLLRACVFIISPYPDSFYSDGGFFFYILLFDFILESVTRVSRWFYTHTRFLMRGFVDGCMLGWVSDGLFSSVIVRFWG